MHEVWIVKFLNVDFTPSYLHAASRNYPVGFAKGLLKLYESHLTSMPGRRDLRFKPQIGWMPNQKDQFEALKMGDTWDDAELLGPLMYLYNSKHLRSGYCLFRCI